MKKAFLLFGAAFFATILFGQIPENYPQKIKVKTYHKLPVITNPQQSEFRVTVFGDKCFLEGDIFVGDTSFLNNFQQMAFSIRHDDWMNNTRWEKSIVPFVFSAGFTRNELVTIIGAMNHIMRNTNVSFRRKNFSDKNFIRFVKVSEEEMGFCGGHSWIGRMWIGGQDITFSCVKQRTAIHEICHALGLYHEQSREDRDNFVRILWNNITPTADFNFVKHTLDATDIGSYDFESVMHYQATAFGKEVDGQTLQTIERISDPSDRSFGRSDVLSPRDVRSINLMYTRDANLPLVSLPPATLPGGFTIGQSKTITIQANNAYNFPNIFVEEGQKFRFRVGENDQWVNGTVSSNADGYTPGFFDGARRQGDFNMMALVAEVFRTNNDVFSFSGTKFRVGTSQEWRATTTGFLNLFANDCMTCYFDNHGSVALTIKRIE